MIIHTDKFHEIYKQPEYANPCDELVDFPLIINVELKRGKGEFMKPSTFYEILNQSREYGAKGIRFQRGEPLAHRNIMSFIRAVRKERLLASLTTSGYLLYLAIDSICNSGLNTFILKIHPDRYISVKKSLSILHKRRKMEPFICVQCVGNQSKEIETDFQECCDDFDWRDDIIDTVDARTKAQWQGLNINWDGSVWLGHGVGAKIGNITETDLYKLWHSDKAKELRDEKSN